MSVKQNVELQNECQEKPKLRTFITIKDFGLTPCYITMPMPFSKRKFLALSRLSNLAIRLEKEQGAINGQGKSGKRINNGSVKPVRMGYL